VLGETPDLSALVRECARVFEPGGTLAVTEQISHPEFHLPSTVRTLAIDAGFVEKAGWDHLSGLTPSVIANSR
jgi:ubiquinone/menaquinone biosynthesis C-methylase UbiE